MLGTVATANAAVVVTTYNFDGDTPVVSSVTGPVTASDMGFSGTIQYFGGNPGDAIAGTGWDGASGAQYFEFTITPDSGQSLDFSTSGLLTFDDDASGTGAADFDIYTSADSFASSIGTGTTSQSFGTSPMNSISLISLGALPTDEAITFRISGFGGSASGGTWRIDNVTTTLEAVPEPSTYAAILGALGLGFVLYRRRKA